MQNYVTKNVPLKVIVNVLKEDNVGSVLGNKSGTITTCHWLTLNDPVKWNFMQISTN